MLISENKGPIEIKLSKVLSLLLQMYQWGDSILGYCGVSFMNQTNKPKFENHKGLPNQ